MFDIQKYLSRSMELLLYAVHSCSKASCFSVAFRDHEVTRPQDNKNHASKQAVERSCTGVSCHSRPWSTPDVRHNGREGKQSVVIEDGLDMADCYALTTGGVEEQVLSYLRVQVQLPVVEAQLRMVSVEVTRCHRLMVVVFVVSSARQGVFPRLKMKPARARVTMTMFLFGCTAAPLSNP